MIHAIKKEDETAFLSALPSRDMQLIYMLGKKTGLRVGDLLKLKKDILRTSRPYVRQEKTGKLKRIYLNKNMLSELKLKSRWSEEYIFENPNTKKPYTRSGVYKAFRAAAEAAGLSYRVGSHSMRKTYACAALERTKNLQAVQNRLQHDNINDTIGYVVDKFMQK